MSETSSARLPVAYFESGRSQTTIAPAIGSQMRIEVSEVGVHLAMRKARTRTAAPAARKKTYVRRRPVWIRRTSAAGVERRLAEVGAALEDHGLLDLAAQDVRDRRPPARRRARS